jgi:hypothetical protein
MACRGARPVEEERKPAATGVAAGFLMFAEEKLPVTNCLRDEVLEKRLSIRRAR